MLPKALIGIVAFCILLVIPLSQFTETHWEAFWGFTFFDALNLLVSTGFALFVSWIVAVRLGDRAKRQEAIYSACIRLDELAGIAVQAAREYAASPLDPDRRQCVASAFKSVTQWMSVIDKTELCRNQMDHLFRIKSAVKALKVAMTDDPYGALSSAHIPAYLARIDRAYSRLMLESFQQRVNLFK